MPPQEPVDRIWFAASCQEILQWRDIEESFDQLVSERHEDLGAGGLGFNRPIGSRKGVSFSSTSVCLRELVKCKEMKAAEKPPAKDLLLCLFHSLVALQRTFLASPSLLCCCSVLKKIRLWVLSIRLRPVHSLC